MAKKRLSKILAWTLTAAMAVSPVNLTWALESEAVDLFTDNSESTESTVVSDEEASLQQTEQDASPIVSGDEEDEAEDIFTTENPEDVFSAGDGAEDSDTSGKKTITGVGKITVKLQEEFIFAPDEEATYRISVDNKYYGIDINLTERQRVSAGNYYTMKTGPGHSYKMSVHSNSGGSTENDIIVKVEKVSPVESISVGESWSENQTRTYPVEPVINNMEIEPNLPVTVTLEDGTTASGRYNTGVDGYGIVGIVYEDADGNLMWEEESGKLRSPRPTTPGTYKYHFYCMADPDIISKAYTFELKSFDNLFGNNNVSDQMILLMLLLTRLHM